MALQARQETDAHASSATRSDQAPLRRKGNARRDRALLQRQPLDDFEAVAVTLLRDLMLADLEHGLAIARDGHEVVPAWRVLAPEGDFLILTKVRSRQAGAA
jgi:hypothetical protein